MKRSRNVRLVLAAGTIASTAILAGCGDDLPPPTENVSFTSVEQCVAQGFLQEACQDQFKAAGAQYLKEAPKFNSLEACQAEFGEAACAPYQQSAAAVGQAAQAATQGSQGSVFVPLMTGFLISQALNDITDRSDYRRYRERHSDYFAGGGGYYGIPYARTPSYNPPRSFPSTVARSSTASAAVTGTARSSTALSTPAPRNFSVGSGSNGRPTVSTPNSRTSTISSSGFGGRSMSVGRGGSASS